jgi:DNA-directed RNA polymerase sigma subunit (sigma70/sigma32)
MTISLDTALQFRSSGGGTEDGPSLYDYAVVQAPDFLPDMTALREALPELLDGLLDQEQFILAYQFGLADGKQHNLGEIADILAACGNPMSHADIYAVQQQALAKLRTPGLAAIIDLLLPGALGTPASLPA